MLSHTCPHTFTHGSSTCSHTHTNHTCTQTHAHRVYKYTCMYTHAYTCPYQVHSHVHTWMHTHVHTCCSHAANACVLIHKAHSGLPEQLKGWGHRMNGDLCHFPFLLAWPHVPYHTGLHSCGHAAHVPTLWPHCPWPPSGWALQQVTLLGGIAWREACAARDVDSGMPTGDLGPGTGDMPLE